MRISFNEMLSKDSDTMMTFENADLYWTIGLSLGFGLTRGDETVTQGIAAIARLNRWFRCGDRQVILGADLG